MAPARKRRISSNAKSKSSTKRSKKTARNLSSEYVEEENKENESDKEYEVEEVLDEDDGDEDGPKLLVKWVGYKQTSWEPKRQIPKKFFTSYCNKKKTGNIVLAKDVSKTSHKSTTIISNNQDVTTSIKDVPNNREKRTSRATKQSAALTSKCENVDKARDQDSHLSKSPSEGAQFEADKVVDRREASTNNISASIHDSDENDEYEVEEVVDEREDELLVRWVGFSKSSWEPRSAIPQHFYDCYRESIRERLEASNQSFGNLCKICMEIEEGGRMCAVCKTPVHHMCWNQLCHEKSLDEAHDVCFCSEECYYSSRSTPIASKQTRQIQLIDNPAIKKQLLRRCVVCDEVGRDGCECITCSKSVHRACAKEIIEELGVKAVRNALFCGEQCYKKWKQDTDKLRKELVRSKAPAKKPPKPPTAPKITKPRKVPTKKTGIAIQDQDDLEQVVGCNVAFSPGNEEWMSTKVYEAVGSLYLAGVVSRQMRDSKTKLIPDCYQIMWTATEFQGKDHNHVVTHAKACEGKRNYDRMMGGHLKSTSWNRLCMSSEDSIHIDADWDELDELDESLVRYETNPSLPIDLAEVEKMKSMDFKTEVHMQAPDNLYHHEDGGISTRLKPESRQLFEDSASSAFLALLPLAFWRKVIENTNQYARDLKQPLVTLDEMMKFLGILFYISTVDKGEYTNYWGDQIENKMFGEISSGLDRVMTLRRFKFIRQNLSFRNGVSNEELKTDPAARIRPLISILRSRAPKFVQLGRNVSVDESSIACRSKYGRHMIVYNATKPTGKYHFKIYMMCCSESWFAVSFKLHCASDLDKRLSGVLATHQIDRFRGETVTTKPLRQHVLEVVMPINNTYRVVNTDNYYTSVQLLEALRVVGLYGRGTIRSDSKFGPKCIMLKKTDQVERGTIRQGVDVIHRMIGASWCDGSIVNMLSTADASTTTTVERMVGRERIGFTAPTCLKEYNQFMQGVDRIDQLRSRFSIADGHTFKKWHKKLALAYIDIARCNAYIARKMTGVYANARDPHREFMIELSSELIHGGWKTAMGDNGLLFIEPNPTRTLHCPVSTSPRPPSPARVSVECTFKHSKDVFTKDERHKRKCVVCRYEGRYASEQTVYCFYHKVCVCAIDKQSETGESYLCPEAKETCWNKYHSFYYPSGVFNVNGNIRRTSTLFQAMKQSRDRRCNPVSSPSEWSSQSSSAPNTPMQFYQPGDLISDNSSLDLGISPLPTPVPTPVPARVTDIQDVYASSEPQPSSENSIGVGSIVQL